ncbi:MAG: restriction endonuclease subunit S [Verrucomicrobiaceae bacterium]|nr:restriction endonuclease subunit S [Verrucomicrobiaceae bacterium]
MTKKVPPKNKAQEPKAQPKAQASEATLPVSAPKGRNISAQGNALGNAFPEAQSPEGARQHRWPVVALSELAADERNAITDGPFGSKLKTEHYTGSGPRVIRLTNIGDGEFIDAKAHISQAHFDGLQKHRVFAGDLVIAALGENPPRSCLVPDYVGEAIVKADCIRFKPSARVVPKYLNYVLNSPDLRRHAKQIVHGVGRPRLNLGEIKSLPIPLPPLPDQRRIVAEIEKQFTRLEAGVAVLRRVQANLKRYRAAVLKAACEGRLVPTEAELSRSGVPPLNPDSTAKPASSKAGSKVSTSPKRQDAASTFESGQQLLARILTERRQNWQGRGKYKEPEPPDISNDPALPEGWTYASVETVGFVQLGRQRSPKHHTGQNMRPYLRVANVYEDRIDLGDVKEMNFTPDEFEVFKLVPNDILLNEGQSLELVGRPAIYRGELPGACFTNTLVRFRPCPSLDVRYALSVFRAYMHSGRFQKIANWTTNIAHLGADRFAKLPFPLPPLAEQTRIVAEVERRLSVVEELEAVVTTNLQRATRLRQSILQKAFTREL